MVLCRPARLEPDALLIIGLPLELVIIAEPTFTSSNAVSVLVQTLRSAIADILMKRGARWSDLGIKWRRY